MSKQVAPLDTRAHGHETRLKLSNEDINWIFWPQFDLARESFVILRRGRRRDERLVISFSSRGFGSRLLLQR